MSVFDFDITAGWQIIKGRWPKQRSDELNGWIQLGMSMGASQQRSRVYTRQSSVSRDQIFGTYGAQQLETYWICERSRRLGLVLPVKQLLI